MRQTRQKFWIDTWLFWCLSESIRTVRLLIGDLSCKIRVHNVAKEIARKFGDGYKDRFNEGFKNYKNSRPALLTVCEARCTLLHFQLFLWRTVQALIYVMFAWRRTPRYLLHHRSARIIREFYWTYCWSFLKLVTVGKFKSTWLLLHSCRIEWSTPTSTEDFRSLKQTTCVMKLRLSSIKPVLPDGWDH
jgi:phage-related protein